VAAPDPWEDRDAEMAYGSNNWAVAGSHTTHGGALLADDMHLGLGVPNTWYRASLVFETAGGERRVTGVMLPGSGFVVVGSNGQVAWGSPTARATGPTSWCSSPIRERRRVPDARGPRARSSARPRRST
jgi:penicillin amidase